MLDYKPFDQKLYDKWDMFGKKVLVDFLLATGLYRLEVKNYGR